MWVRYVRFLLGVSVCLMLSGPVIAADSTPPLPANAEVAQALYLFQAWHGSQHGSYLNIALINDLAPD